MSSSADHAVGQHVAIVGGGMLGMTLAWRLRQQGVAVTIVERAAHVGGLASADTIGDVTWDRFYHVILASDTRLRGLLEELGLADRLIFGTTKTGLLIDGTLRSLSSAAEYATFPGLSLIDKARLAWTLVYGGHVRDVAALESVPAVEWLQTHSGRRVTERLWLPLLRSKLGTATDSASAVFIQASIARLSAARRAGMQREQFGFVDGGYSTVLSRFRDRLVAAGVTICEDAAVTSVQQGASEATIAVANREPLEADLVVLTVPCSRIATLCAQLMPAERDRLASVRYQGIVCASALLAHPLSPYYISNLADGGPWPFTGVIEMTALVDRARFGGRSLIYLPRYAAPEDDVWSMDDASIETAMRDGLARLHPSFKQESVVAFRVHRVREVFAIPTVHYTRDRCPSVRTSLDRVTIVNSAQITDGTLNVNETVALADRQVPALLQQLRRIPARALSGAPC